jgi:hypothetical protein
MEYNKRYKVRLCDTIQNNLKEWTAFQYNFKPESLLKSQEGSLEVENGSVLFTFKAEDDMPFDMNGLNAKSENDYVICLDNEEFQLRKLSSTVNNLKRNRDTSLSFRSVPDPVVSRNSLSKRLKAGAVGKGTRGAKAKATKDAPPVISVPDSTTPSSGIPNIVNIPNIVDSNAS